MSRGKYKPTPSEDRKRFRAAQKQRTIKSTGHNPIRVRSKRLHQMDSAKVTLAYWLLAKAIVEDRTDDRELTAERVAEMAATLSDDDVQSQRERAEAARRQAGSSGDRDADNGVGGTR